MDEKKDTLELLDMMVQPVFCVKDNFVIRANTAARQMLLREGEDIRPLLETGAEEYENFREGCLYLSLRVAGESLAATVRPFEDCHLFELEQSSADALRAMALASSQLRHPLAGALSHMEALLEEQKDPQLLEQLAGLNRELYRMLRLLGNMSDAQQTALFCRPVTEDAGQVIRDIFEKTIPFAQKSGFRLEYQGLEETLYCLLDKQQLERALLNLLSNAMKFSPKDSLIRASLTRRNRTLILTVQDSGSGISQEILGSLYRRHLRQPGIEDSRYGIGLGMQIVHAAAQAHGGTVLVTRGEQGGTRVVMTLAIRQNPTGTLHSPVFDIDYSGGFDHRLVELSDSLSWELFDGNC